MPYCAYEDIVEELNVDVLSQITEETSTLEKVSTAIERADSIIDSYLSRRTQVPISPVPQSVKEYSVDIAIWTLFSRVEAIPKFREQRYWAAMAWLKAYAAGETELGTPYSGSESNPQAAQFYSVDKDFSDEVWSKY